MAKANWKTQTMTDVIVAMAKCGWDYMESCNGNTLYFVADSMPEYGAAFLWLEEEFCVKKFSLEAVEYNTDDCMGLDRVLVVEIKEEEDMPAKKETTRIASLFDDDDDDDYLWKKVY